ncbi:hypothetical protein M758_11G065500 [Ceratodon purpureus]|uniref:Peptidase S54 rhomboid domain-containing protein n=1 Tax=Ceratodon purpureus TaxID=3225 RepID=A0A8T0GDM4_CERPU|nr:hypothetical protein KC19_11G067300 [Ceratodon purpureus]KAG0600847.1 hypothetical protein M758_11G065500 [Ceratodon purpureus]
MAMVQGMQTVLFSRIRQLNPPHQFIDSSSNLKDCTCRGYRDDRSQVHSQTKQIISSEIRKQRFTRRAHQLRLSQRDPEWLTYQSTRNSRLHSSGGGRRRELVYCLRTSEVEQVETDVSAEEKPVNSTVEVKNVDAKETEDWAVKKGLSALDAYFDKLNASRVEETPSGTSYSEVTANRVSTTVPPSTTGRSESVVSSQNSQVSHTGTIKKDHLENHEKKNTGGLSALDAYFNKLRPSEPETVVKEDEEMKKAPEESKPRAGNEDEKKLNIKIISASTPIEEDEEADYKELMEELEKALEQQAASGSAFEDTDNFLPGSSWGLQAGNSNSYLVNGLVALNIAVYLFGLASPLEVPGMGDASLPFLYGAKVNELIVNGEWWRLATPTFLHSGLLHLGLSTWALLEFGPAVESAYGTLGFSMIYVVGGLFGNLLSFFHTPQGTVGGTGPIYALMATWMVYLLRNREIIGLDVAGDMMRKVVIFTAITYALCNSFPVDDWTHLGAAVVGVIFGLLTCPMVQVNVHVEEVGDNNDDDAMESYLLLNEGLHPYRLFLVFGLSLAVFFALYSVGVPYATEFHFLHGGLGDEYW